MTSPHEPITFLRSAAGSPVAPSIIRALRANPGVRVVAVDCDPLSCGFWHADAHHVVPRVSDPEYLTRLLEICREERVDVLFPDLDEELPLMAAAADRIAGAGIRLILSSGTTIDTCRDKYKTHEFFLTHGIPAPQCWLATELPAAGSLPFPLIVKPRGGRGSRDVYRVDAADELECLIRRVSNPVVQQFIEGVEFTVDTLSDLAGNYLYCSVRERVLADSGISVKGRTVRHPEIERRVSDICGALRFVGPACIQCIESPRMGLRFIEINPRIAGGTALSLAAGAPIVDDLVKMVRGLPHDGPRGYRSGTIMIREWREHFLDAQDE